MERHVAGCSDRVYIMYTCRSLVQRLRLFAAAALGRKFQGTRHDNEEDEVESAAIAAAHAAGDPPGAAPGEKGLKSNAIGYISNVVIGVASVAPAYSLAATLGFVVAVAGVGLKAPAVMLVALIPMF